MTTSALILRNADLTDALVGEISSVQVTFNVTRVEAADGFARVLLPAGDHNPPLRVICAVPMPLFTRKPDGSFVRITTQAPRGRLLDVRSVVDATEQGGQWWLVWVAPAPGRSALWIWSGSIPRP